MKIAEIVAAQRAYFHSGATRPLRFRLDALRRLRRAVADNERTLGQALYDDLHKTLEESYLTEIGLVLQEISFHEKHLPRWSRPRRVRTPLALFPARSFILTEPYGLALIIAPWNYPLQLCLLPLIGAISAGNCAVVKPSAYAPAASAAMAKLLGETFPPEYVAVVEGGRDQNSALLEQKFDYIFFTGSVAVGRAVMAAAAANLTPVTLELGGKSPVIVDATADLRLAARRIAFGKVTNAGQTCVAPDYLLIDATVKEQFISCYRAALAEFFPAGDMSAMPSLVNDRHFQRVCGLMAGEQIALGGAIDAARRFIEPTLLDNVSPDSAVMGEEIFGPLLPMLTFSQPREALDFIAARPRPLALYLFSSDRPLQREALSCCSFGGGCINDTLLQAATPYLPFGGVGASGLGSYHGRASFETFTHDKSVVRKSRYFDLALRYPPYTEKTLALARRFLK